MSQVRALHDSLIVLFGLLYESDVRVSRKENPMGRKDIRVMCLRVFKDDADATGRAATRRPMSRFSSGLFEQSRLLFLPCYSVRRRSIRFVIRLVPRAVVVDRIESCIRSRYFFLDGEPCLEDDADFFFASAAIVASGGPSCAPCNSLTMSFISSLSKKLRLS